MTVLAAGPLRLAGHPSRRHASTWQTLARSAGPALLIAAGYVDPGNWGADVAAGTQFGLRLMWVMAAAILGAVVLQQLAARLGIAGHDLAGLIRYRFPSRYRRCLSAPVLAALVVTEVVEVFGLMLGIRMLSGCGTAPAAVAAAVLVLLVLWAPGGVARRIVYGCLTLIGVVYLGAAAMSGGGTVLTELKPAPLPPGGIPVAVGLIGSIIMPHNLLLHSALTRDLSQAREARLDNRRWLRGCAFTSTLALGMAFAVNASITYLAAQSNRSAAPGVAMMTDLHHACGHLATTLFAVTLVASGLSSATTGAMISTNVFAQLLPFSGAPSVRPLLYLLPAAAINAVQLPEVTILVWSQVALTCALPFVLVPLLIFTSQRGVMGDLVTGLPTRLLALILTITLAVAGILSVVGM